MSKENNVVELKETKIVTPNDLGKELKQDPRLIRRILRQRFEKQGRTWGWPENSEELNKVKSYIGKQLKEMEEEKIQAKKLKEKKSQEPVETVSATE